MLMSMPSVFELAWLTYYLTKRKQYTVVNGAKSDTVPKSPLTPRKVLFSPQIFSHCVISGLTYMSADDTRRIVLFKELCG